MKDNEWLRLSTWEDRREWANQFDEPVRAALGIVFFRKGSHWDDVKRATDLVNMRLGPNNSGGVRVRNADNYQGRYRCHITFRAGTESNRGQSELVKLRAGCGDWYFYGFANAPQGVFLPAETPPSLLAYTVINLSAFREADKLGLLTSETWRENGVTFESFDMRVFKRAPSPIIVATTVPELYLGQRTG